VKSPLKGVNRLQRDVNRFQRDVKVHRSTVMSYQCGGGIARPRRMENKSRTTLTWGQHRGVLRVRESNAAKYKEEGEYCACQIGM